MKLPATRWGLLRLLVWDRDQGVCGICGDAVGGARFDADHVVPVAAGGIDCMDNIRVAHPLCNSIRGGKFIASQRALGVPAFGYTMKRPTCGDHCGVFPSIKLARDLHAKLIKLAEREHRSLHGQIVYLLERAVAADQP